MTKIEATKRSIWATGAVAAGYVIGYLSAFSTPVVIGNMMQRLGLSEQEVGAVVGLELMFIALATISLSIMAITPSLRIQSIVGALLALLGHGLTILTESLEWLLLARAVAGFGEGLILAGANRLGASLKNSDREFAIAQLALSVFTMFMLTTVPYSLDFYDYRSGSVGILLVIILFLPVIFRFPEPELDSSEELQSASKLSRFPSKAFGVPVLIAFALLSLADVAMWTFTEQIASGIGISTKTAGAVMGGATALGLCGAVTAAILGNRLGRLWPMVLGLGVLAFAVVGQVYARDVASYAVCLLSLNFVILFLTPFFLGTLSELDHSGSWATVSGVLIPIAFSLGPVLAGAVAESQSYVVLGWMTGCFAITALVLMVAVILHPKSPFRRHVGSENASFTPR